MDKIKEFFKLLEVYGVLNNWVRIYIKYPSSQKLYDILTRVSWCGELDCGLLFVDKYEFKDNENINLVIPVDWIVKITYRGQKNHNFING